MAKVLFIGPKPPPVSGYANIVAELAHLLSSHVDLIYLSTVPCLLRSLYPSRSWICLRQLYLLLKMPYIFVLMLFRDIIYLNINGGAAQWFDLIVVFFSRCLCKRIYIHHNSYGYINRYAAITDLVFKFSGPKTIHVVNCRKMGQDLSDTYTTVKHTLAISNIAILARKENSIGSCNSKIGFSAGGKVRSHGFTVGFMGYYDQHKGLDLFVETIRIANENNVLIRGMAVGPVYDVTFFKQVRANAPQCIEFLPPVYGLDKEKFFESIDVLLFPSKYANEAEPLVVHDALAAGVNVIATDVGCLPAVLQGIEGCYIFTESTFSAKVSELLAGYVTNYASGIIGLDNALLKNNYSDFLAREMVKFDVLVQSIKN